MNQPTLTLTPERTARLLGYLQRSRCVLLTQLAPSTERNQQQRLLQGIQGRLLQQRERPGAVWALWLSGEELAALRVMALELLAVTRQEPASQQRDATLLDLATLKHTLERLALAIPPRPVTSALW